MSLIGDSRLSLRDIPPTDAPWEEIAAFALTIDGYEVAGSIEAAAAIARSPGHYSLSDQRVALFYLQRTVRHGGETATPEELGLARRLVQRIRELVTALR